KVVYEEPQPLAERVPGLDPAIAAAVARAMAKKQDERFKTASDFLEGLTGRPTSVMRPPRPKSGGAKVADSNPTNISSEEALAQTVGSGDHGKPPMAVADTLASGDHKDSRPTIGTGAGLAKETKPPAPPPEESPAQKPRPRALLFGIAAVVVVGGVALAIALTRK